MSSSRRDFLKRLGIALASLVSARCARTPAPDCYIVALPSPTPGASGQRDQPSGLPPELERLRRCWLDLEGLGEQTQKDSDGGQRIKEELVVEHRAALDVLVADSQLEPPVADQVQVAFEAAAFHVWRSNAPMLCYQMMQVNFTPTSSGDLVRQAELLAENGDLDPDTIALAQTAIARDMAFLGMSPKEIQTLYDEIVQAHVPEMPYPTFEEIDLDVSPEAAQAARFLVELLLED